MTQDPKKPRPQLMWPIQIGRAQLLGKPTWFIQINIPIPFREAPGAPLELAWANFRWERAPRD